MISLAMLRIVTTTLNGFAQFCTFLRIEYRRRNKNFWFDDAVASFATICSFIALVCFWLTTETPDAGPMVQSQSARYRAYWILSTTTILVIWSSRVAIMSSFIRILRRTPSAKSSVMQAYCLTAFIAAMGTALFVLRIYFCSRDNDWKSLDVPTCPDNRILKPLNIACELLSDLVMVEPPVVFILLAKHTQETRRALWACVGVNIVLMASSIVHLVFVIRSDDQLETLTSGIQIALFLAMTNIPAIIDALSSRHEPDNLDRPKHTGIRGRIGAPTALHSLLFLSTPPIPKEKPEASSTDKLPVLNQLGPLDLFTQPINRQSAAADSISEYSIVSSVTSPEPAKRVDSQLLVPNQGRDVVSSYSSIFAQYSSEEPPLKRILKQPKPPSEVVHSPVAGIPARF